MNGQSKISIQRLTKVFYRRGTSVTALKDVSMEIADGEFVCLLGPSGCGKTTLLRILAGLEKPSSGSFAIRQSDPSRPLKSMVFQERGIIPWLSVEENAAFGLRMRHVPEPVVKERTAYFLEKVGLSRYAKLFHCRVDQSLASASPDMISAS